jgi:xanthine/CO dehydrogenase XdhC/CoxF family maturation factor
MKFTGARFKMAVAADGELYGTIGGGIMEFKLVEKARSLLHSGVKDIKLIEQFHDKTHDKIVRNDHSGVIVFCPLNTSRSKRPSKIVEAKSRMIKPLYFAGESKLQMKPSKGLTIKQRQTGTILNL